MNTFIYRRSVLAIAAILFCTILFFGSSYGQTETTEQKRQRAEAAFEEAVNLFNQQTKEGFVAGLEKSQQAGTIFDEIKDKSENAGLSWMLSGLLSSNLGENDDALNLYDKALKFFRENNYVLWEATTLNNIGMVYASLSEHQKALDFYKQAQPLVIKSGNKPTESLVINNIGYAFASLGDFKNALENYESSLSISREIGDKAGEARTLGNMGLVLNTMGNNQKALEYYNLALPLSREVNDKTMISANLNNLGKIYNDLGENKKSLDYYEQALPLFRELGDQSKEAGTINNIGLLYSDLGDKQKALDYFSQALILTKKIGNRTGEAGTLNNIGLLYDSIGESRKGLDYCNRALPITRETGDKIIEATTLNNIGKIYSNLGENQKALEFYNQSLMLKKELGSKSGEATTLSNIGLVYSDLGDKKRALEYYFKAMPLMIEVGNKSGLSVTLINIGSVYDSLNEPQKALENFTRALQITREVGDKTNEATALSNIGLIYIATGDNQKALEYFNNALAINQKVGDVSQEASILNNIGLVYSNSKDYQKSLEYFSRARTLQKQIGDKSSEAVSLTNLMYIWNLQKNSTLAVFYGKQAVNVFQQLRSNIKKLDKEVQQTYLQSIEDNYRTLSEIMIADGRLLEAQAVLDLLKEEEFEKLLTRSGNSEENVPYSQAEKDALIVIESLARLGREKSELDEKLENGSLTETEKEKFKIVAKNIELAETEFNKTLTALTESKNNSKNLEVVVADAQAFMATLAELGKGTAALYTVVVNKNQPFTADGKSTGEKTELKTGWIILVTPEFRKAYQIDVTNLEQSVFAFRAALSSPEYNPEPLARELYVKLFRQTGKDGKTLEADLNDYYKDKPEKTLMWSLDGVLRYVPIAALHDGTDYLLKKYRNTIFNTASKDRLKNTSPINLSVLGLGVSEAREESGKRFSQLAGAKQELETIVKESEQDQGIVRGKIIINQQFTADNMRDAIAFDRNPIVHIASHFSYNAADFNDSFLLLGQGKITVKDLTAKSGLLNNVDLIALSACDTAVGTNNGKDVEGFAYVAQSLGAKSVIATLWQVDDIGTQVLMPEFYRLRSENLGKGEALRLAQIALLDGKLNSISSAVKRADPVSEDNDLKLERFEKNKDKPFAHPFYWSPFVLIGNWK